MISWKVVVSNLPIRFCMVGMRYFAFAPNTWYSIRYHNYGRTWSITSLPGLVFRRKAVFYVFVSVPRIFPLRWLLLKEGGGGKIKKRKSGVISFFFVVETKGFEPLTSAMWLQRSKPAGLRLYFRLAMQSNKKFGDLATYWRFFLSWSGIFSGFS